MEEKIPISGQLDENIANMEKLFHTCDDIKKKEMLLGKDMDVRCYLMFLEVSVDSGASMLSDLLKYLRTRSKDEILQLLKKMRWASRTLPILQR